MKFSHGLKFKKGVYYLSPTLNGWTDDMLNYPPPSFDSEEDSIAYTSEKQKELVVLIEKIGQKS